MSTAPSIPALDWFAPPSDAHALTVCKAGKGAETCRYLDEVAAGWSCLRHTEATKFVDLDVFLGRRGGKAINCEGRGARCTL